ncbi:MAG: hypothetical protein OXN84_04645 [Albidovulum sp.]|nr:hypothetical protein [Albidovulum sp.]
MAEGEVDIAFSSLGDFQRRMVSCDNSYRGETLAPGFEFDGDLNGFCLGTVVFGSRAITGKGLRAHTCYSYRGDLGIDQIFDADGLAYEILFMPEFDVGPTLSGLEVGARAGLSPCDGSDLQQIILTVAGVIGPAKSTEMCFTAG